MPTTETPFSESDHNSMASDAGAEGILLICHGEFYDHRVNSLRLQTSQKQQGNPCELDQSPLKKNPKQKKEGPSVILFKHLNNKRLLKILQVAHSHFMKLFSRALIDHTVKQTNLYSRHHVRNFDLNEQDFWNFLVLRS